MIKVSVIVPCYNEEKHIFSLLSALNQQTYPISDMELIIVDGLSTDRTRDVIKSFQNLFPGLQIFLVDNPKRSIPVALNLGIQKAIGEYIIRVDAHSTPDRKYVENCVVALAEGKGKNVGGRWVIIPSDQKSFVSRAIAAAVAHPLGAGDASYRYSEKASYVDTVPFGAFRRSTLLEMGGYDENLLSNEDYDLNVRIRRNGGKIWFDPQIRSKYIARSDYCSLAAQYYRYGFWKRKMLTKYPESIRLRQAIPPLFLLIIAIFFIAGFIFHTLWIGLGLILGFYCLALLVAGALDAIKSKDCGKVIGMPAAFFIIHFSWAIGFVISHFNKG